MLNILRLAIAAWVPGVTSRLQLRHAWFLPIFLFCSVIVLSNLAHFVIFRVLRHKAKQNQGGHWHSVQQYLSRPARAIFLITCLLIVLPTVPQLPARVQAALQQGLAMALVAVCGWFAVGCVYVFQSAVLRKYDLTAENNIRARQIHTQFQLFRSMGIAFIVVVDIGVLLWTVNDPRIWHYGSGLLASAGIASVIVATAAKSTVANLFAGLQIAVSEPIRIDHVVVVQGEWGRIEEINSAYVIIKIWDQRRLVVPLSYFIENSFQNWTRQSSDILGTAFLYVDYSVPVEDLRRQLNVVAEASPLWDKRVCSLKVTNLSEHCMELRCLVSSRNASDNFDLRCLVREEMTAWIQQNHPAAFPITRLSAVAPSSFAQVREQNPVDIHDG